MRSPCEPARLMPGRRVSLFWALCAVAGVILLTFVLLPSVSMIVGAGAGMLGEALRQDDVRRSLLVTVGAALVTTAIGFVFGVPLAYLLARKDFPGKRAVEGIIDVPIVFPHTAAGIALLTVYGRDGIMGRLLAPLGITFTETLAGIVLAMVFVSLPFLVDGSREAFALVDERYEHVARTLGSSRFGAFARVTFPQAWRGVLAGAVLMWGRGISEFGAVVILAYNPKVISVLTFERFEGFGLRAAQPPAVLIVIIAFVVFLLVRTFLVPRRRTGARGRQGTGAR
ncbi:MAG TPA: ABC transporter permease [Thermoleophilia bacterium]|nr:ABC transporter permease [Thermoleophilia bacterium]